MKVSRFFLTIVFFTISIFKTADCFSKEATLSGVEKIRHYIDSIDILSYNDGAFEIFYYNNSEDIERGIIRVDKIRASVEGIFFCNKDILGVIPVYEDYFDFNDQNSVDESIDDFEKRNATTRNASSFSNSELDSNLELDVTKYNLDKNLDQRPDKKPDQQAGRHPFKKYLSIKDIYFMNGHFCCKTKKKVLRLKKLRANNAGVYYIERDLCTSKKAHSSHDVN